MTPDASDEFICGRQKTVLTCEIPVLTVLLAFSAECTQTGLVA